MSNVFFTFVSLIAILPLCTSCHWRSNITALADHTCQKMGFESNSHAYIECVTYYYETRSEAYTANREGLRPALENIARQLKQARPEDDRHKICFRDSDELQCIQ